MLIEKPIPESYWVIPDKFLAGEYPHIRYDDLQSRKRLEAFLDAGFDSYLDLTCEGERAPYFSTLSALAASSGRQVHYLRFSFPDFMVPTRAEMAAALDALDLALAGQGKVYLHCVGGIGRTGTTVACHLIRHGMSPEAALGRLREMYSTSAQSRIAPHSPEADAQVHFILDWKEDGLA
jgi:hypothetical protein